MKRIAHGIDAVDVDRFARSIEEHGQRFIDRLFTPAEQAYAEGKRRRFEHLAARFAIKEATFKALGTGQRDGITWHDAEVTLDGLGCPSLNISGRAAEIAAQQGIAGWVISITHTDTIAIGSVMGWMVDQPPASG